MFIPGRGGIPAYHDAQTTDNRASPDPFSYVKFIVFTTTKGDIISMGMMPGLLKHAWGVDNKEHVLVPVGVRPVCISTFSICFQGRTSPTRDCELIFRVHMLRDIS